jgi:hypothetical protein
MVLTSACLEKEPELRLLDFKELHFPSASGIECYKDTLFVFGDDASQLLVLDSTYRPVDSVRYLSDTSYRIPKALKPDIESAMILKKEEGPALAGVGSRTTERTTIAYEFLLSDIHRVSERKLFSPVPFRDIKEVNIEGSTMAGNKMVLANRGNNSNKMNHLLFWNQKDSLTTAEIVLKKDTAFIGISGLYYLEEKDLLLITASTEHTSGALIDGAIGDSYLGWIRNFSKKMYAGKLRPDRLVKLTGYDMRFTKQKIESVCVQRTNGNQMILHLVADNDDGMSRIFKLSLIL